MTGTGEQVITPHFPGDKDVKKIVFKLDSVTLSEKKTSLTIVTGSVCCHDQHTKTPTIPSTSEFAMIPQKSFAP